MRFTLVAELGIRPGVLGVAVVGIHHMARRATGIAVIARLIVGANKPGEGVIESSFSDIDNGNGYAVTGAGATV